MADHVPAWITWLKVLGIGTTGIALFAEAVCSARENAALKGASRGTFDRSLFPSQDKRAPFVGVVARQLGLKQGGAVVARQLDVVPIEKRVAAISDLIIKYGEHPESRQAAATVLAKRCGKEWCIPEKSWNAEAKALFAHVRADARAAGTLFRFVREQVRYVRDPTYRDTFTAPDVTLDQGIADCDDYSVALGALLIATGHKLRLRIVQTKDAKTWDHIYLRVNPEADGKRWIAADASVDQPFGWEVPAAHLVPDAVGTAQRPPKTINGIVVLVRDFPVEPRGAQA